MLAWIFAFASVYALDLDPVPASQASTPAPLNVLWITIEDLSPFFDLYGNKLNEGKTPHFNRLAEQGQLFERCFVPAPVCSPCRSALITGAMATSLGIHQHRSSRSPEDRIELPPLVRTLPELFREQGYFTFNRGKDDYNFGYDREALYTQVSNRSGWRDRAPDQPFFGQIQLRGGKHAKRIESGKSPLEELTSPTEVEVPPYFPDIQELRQAFATHHDAARWTDLEVGEILEALAKDDLLQSTVVFVFSDHGMNTSLRHKQFCYEGGLHVPFVLFVPESHRTFQPGSRCSDLISALDISATTLSFIGQEDLPWVEGHNLLDEHRIPRTHVISARDRCDYTIDRIRTVRTERYRYIKNYLSDRPWMQPQYRDSWAMVKKLRNLSAEGKLEHLPGDFFGQARPGEELYDLENDPHQIHNLANDPEAASILAMHQGILDGWILATGDRGQWPESKNGLRAVLNQWKNKCVNPEYDAIR